MMAGNPSWWSMHPPSQQTSALLSSPSPSLFPPQYVIGSPSLPFNSVSDNNQQDLPQSWSQLLMGGISGDEDHRLGLSHFQPKKLENWEDQLLKLSPSAPVVDVKQEVSQNSNYGLGDEEFQALGSAWSQIMPVSSPRSFVTNLSNTILDFSYNTADGNSNQFTGHSSECNSTTTGGMCKKARVQPSSSQPSLKVRKEKLGDRITTLHQLVSPFGKTDTASVLLEAIGYIRFLQGQIEALSSPYLVTKMRNQQSVQGERKCVFPEDPGQLLNDVCLKRKGVPNQNKQDKPKDLRSRGLCLVPVYCTQQVDSDKGADYWAPAFGDGL